MDFLRKLEGNRHSIGRKFPQKRRKMDKLAFKVIENRLMKKSGLNGLSTIENFAAREHFAAR